MKVFPRHVFAQSGCFIHGNRADPRCPILFRANFIAGSPNYIFRASTIIAFTSIININDLPIRVCHIDFIVRIIHDHFQRFIVQGTFVLPLPLILFVKFLILSKKKMPLPPQPLGINLRFLKYPNVNPSAICKGAYQTISKIFGIMGIGAYGNTLTTGLFSVHIKNPFSRRCFGNPLPQR